MKMASSKVKAAFLALCSVSLIYGQPESAAKYEPNWESLDKRTLPDWYDEAKIGIFIHWGVYAVPGRGEWFWSNWKIAQHPGTISFMQKYYKPGFSYQEFGPEFTARYFNALDWANLFQNSGARYVVLTSKHHEGFTLWPSKHSFGWNAKDIGPKKDLVGELANALRQTTDLKFGLYYSLYEWFNPLYLSDKNSNFTDDFYVRNKVLPELTELVNTYKPEVVWSDGEWEVKDDYWKSKEFLAWLYNESPVRDTVVVNDRWGSETLCKHGGFYTCKDRYNPGKLQERKWENAMTIDKFTWGYREDAEYSDFFTSEELIHIMVTTVSTGGNILINVGPSKEGVISPIFQERLLDMGSWLQVNGEAIYATKPWKKQNDSASDSWYTSKGDVIYAIALEWPDSNKLELGYVFDLFKSGGTPIVSLLGVHGTLEWELNHSDSVVEITLPDRATVKDNWAWALKIVP